MFEITIQDAAEMLGVGVNSIQTYIAQGKLSGDASRGVVDAASVEGRHTRLARERTRHFHILRAALEGNSLSEQERAAVTMRVVDLETFACIGDSLGISRQGAQLIIKRVVDRLQKEIATEAQLQRELVPIDCLTGL